MSVKQLRHAQQTVASLAAPQSFGVKIQRTAQESSRLQGFLTELRRLTQVHNCHKELEVLKVQAAHSYLILAVVQFVHVRRGSTKTQPANACSNSTCRCLLDPSSSCPRGLRMEAPIWPPACCWRCCFSITAATYTSSCCPASGSWPPSRETRLGGCWPQRLQQRWGSCVESWSTACRSTCPCRQQSQQYWTTRPSGLC